MGDNTVPKQSRSTDFIPWSDEYSVHFRLIDYDHQNLFEIINTLHAGIERGLTSPEINIAIAGLARYVDEHFEREEELMEQCAYPALGQHKEFHRDLIRKVYAMRKVHLERPNRINPARLMRFLERWLVHHILGEDMKYVPYLRGEASEAFDQSGDCTGSPRASDYLAKYPHKEIVEITIRVPSDKVELIQRCALLIRRGGEEARALEDLANPTSSMTVDEAESICREMLSDDPL